MLCLTKGVKGGPLETLLLVSKPKPMAAARVPSASSLWAAGTQRRYRSRLCNICEWDRKEEPLTATGIA